MARMVLRHYDVEVSLTGPFPIDMLRHDSAWPYSGEDATKILDLCDKEVRHEWRHAGKKTAKVRLSSYDEPTVGRWESFGCLVHR